MIMWGWVTIRQPYPFECVSLFRGSKFGFLAFMVLTLDFLFLYIPASLKSYSQRLHHTVTLGDDKCK